MHAAKELACDVGVQPACAALGVARATYYRHQRAESTSRREECAREANDAPRSSPRALSAGERQAVLDVLHAPRFVDRAPAAVYAQLLDENRYFCSIRTMYRLLDANHEVRERRDQLRHPQYHKPELLATAPNQVWSWDITKLLGPKKWTYYYLYVILDIFSRYAVGWLLAERENADLAARLIRETCHKHDADPQQLTLHSDRGPAMKSHTVAQLLAALGVTKSHSRPHVSNDNPFSESQFKTLKYRPEFPERFASYDEGRAFCGEFFPWYNDEHYHSALGLLTPAAVHYGRSEEVLAVRRQALRAAHAAHPERFVHGPPQPIQPPAAVYINPPQRPSNANREENPVPAAATAAAVH
jgi:putative transposase